MSEPVIVLANREPFRHQRDHSGAIVAEHASAGVVNAVEPLIRARGGVWVAHGSGTADREIALDRDGVLVPPGAPQYRLRRVWLDAEEEQGYYYGFANEGLWPLCHQAHVRPVFRASDFSAYSLINGRFAQAACDEATSDQPIVLVQDYHFALAPLLIRARLPRSTIVTFWHIPWPQSQTFEICPWRHDLLEGLLNSDVLAFQMSTDGANFIETARHVLQVNVDETEQVIVHGGRRVLVRTHPASVDWHSALVRDAPPIETCRATVRHALGLPEHVRLVVGIDRMDYTKGLEEKLLAFERLFEWYPALRGQVTFVQVAEPSRTCLPAYRDFRCRVLREVERINERFGSGGSAAVRVIETHQEPAAVYELLRAAEVCYVGSIRDGMNLVCKEFLHARDDEQGVLVLSRFAGAAEELTEALLVNPYDIDDAANALATALSMPEGVQRERMRGMRALVAAHDATWWGQQLLADAARARQLRVVRQIRPDAGRGAGLLALRNTNGGACAMSPR